MYKRLLLYSIDDSVENSIGKRLYPRTEAPGTETPEKYRVYYNLFSGVSAPEIEFSSLSSIEYIISSQEFLELLS